MVILVERYIKQLIMNKTLFLAALAALSLGSVSCREKDRPLPGISLFCDHIETVARQEGISFAEAAARIKAVGYEGADVRVLQRPDAIKTLDSLGFKHSCAITDIDYTKGDQREIEDKTIAFMDENGYDRLLLVLGVMPEDGLPAEEIDSIRRRVASFAGRVAAKGYTIMVEDYDSRRSLTFNSERIDSLFAVSKDLGLVFDSGNFIFAGEDALDRVDYYRDKIGHVHLKDRTSLTDMRCVPIGTGCVPIADVIGKLVEIGYTGWLTVEQFGSRNMLADSETSFKNVSAALARPE